MTDQDWHDAQVVEASTPIRYGGRRLIFARHESDCGRPEPAAWWTTLSSPYDWNHDQLSDVRVIVDAEGRVTPPEITDEMVETLARSIFGGADWVWESPKLKVENDHKRAAARAALTAALGGHDG